MFTVVFPAGSVVNDVQSAFVRIIDDANLEFVHNFLVNFSSSYPPGVMFGSPNELVVTIIDNDGE